MSRLIRNTTTTVVSDLLKRFDSGVTLLRYEPQPD
jgi:hypothetical protein